jgi:DNA repair protein RadC
MKNSPPLQYEIPMPDNADIIECTWAIYTLEKFSPEKIPYNAQAKILAIADKIVVSRLKRGANISSPGDAKDVLKALLQNRQDEVVAVAFLNSKHDIIKFEELFHWTIDSAQVYTRTLVKRALHHNAAACLMVHNHPSWNPKPSGADINITKRAYEALELINVKLLDHLVVGTDGVVSLAETGEL